MVSSRGAVAKTRVGLLVGFLRASGIRGGEVAVRGNSERAKRSSGFRFKRIHMAQTAG